MGTPFTFHYTSRCAPNGFEFVFFCDLCQRPTHVSIRAAGQAHRHLPYAKAQAFQKAVYAARLRFNRCRGCLRWVCDQDFDLDAGLCAQCAKESGIGESAAEPFSSSDISVPDDDKTMPR